MCTQSMFIWKTDKKYPSGIIKYLPFLFRCGQVRWMSDDNLEINYLSRAIFKPGYEKMCLVSYANNKGADQPAHPRSLINAFVVHCLDSIISLDSIADMTILMSFLSY